MIHNLARFSLAKSEAFRFSISTSTARAIIRAGLTVVKLFGLFSISRYITRNGLRILCYHGFAVAEEYKFRGTLFIRKELFHRRIDYLQRKRFPIMALSAAVEALYRDQLPPCATVITMDDAWEGVYSVAMPIIEELGLPVTLYVPTYYIEHPMPVFPVALSYLFWRTQVRRVNLPRGLGTFQLDTEAEAPERLAQEYGALLPAVDRLTFLKEVAEVLAVPFDEIEEERLFRVVDERQLRQLADLGVDIQLHTHSHECPLDDRAKVEGEIVANRNFLRRSVSRPLEHFCYPSGVYAPHQGEWLAALGLKSATTIEPGLNYPDTPRFILHRLVDGHRVSDIEFEAEVTGFMEIVRAVRQRRFLSMLRRRFRPQRGNHGNTATAPIRPQVDRFQDRALRGGDLQRPTETSGR